MEEGLIDVGAVQLHNAKETDGQDTVRVALEVLDHPDSGFLVVRRPLSEEVTVARVFVRKARQVSHSWRIKSQVETVVNDAIAKLFESLRDGEDGSGRLMAGSELRDTRRLDEIYKTLPSPALLDAESASGMKSSHYRLIEECQRLGPADMRSTLYQYQKRSLSRMLQIELAPGRIREPEYLEMREGTEGGGRAYFLDTKAWIFRRELDYYNLPMGGILCEQMGVGKTVICLALIVATRDQMVGIPPNVDFAPAVTEYSLRTFPFDEPARTRLALTSCGFHIPPPTRLPTLAELAFHKLASEVEDALEHPAMPPHIIANVTANDFRKHYFDYDPRKRPRGSLKSPRRISLSTATLVVVPNMLLQQWAAEIRKHVKEGVLKVLEITGNKSSNPLPEVTWLLQYDLVLISQERLSYENKETSELARIRWKRLIIDEGHIAQSRSTSTVDFASHLSVERKWIVTGTPTRHLLGLDADISQQPIPAPSERPAVQVPAGAMVPSPSKKRKRRMVESSSAQQVPQRWYPEEIEDLTRLGSLFSFIGVEPFATLRTKYSSDVMKPLRGDQFGSVHRLHNLMKTLLVRHESKDIRAEMPLPPLEVRSQGLAFDRLGRTTHNVLVALIVSNLITSQATDADYLLHPRNLGDLHQAISNLHLSCLWFTSQNTGFEAAINILERSLSEKVYTPAEVHQLERAVHHLKVARDDPHWAHIMSTTVSVIFDVFGLPHEVFSAYTECRVHSSSLSSNCNTPSSIIAADGLLKIRESARVRQSLEGIVADSMSFFNQRRAGDEVKDVDEAAQGVHLHGAGSNRPAGDTQIKQAVRASANAMKTAIKELGGDDITPVLNQSLDTSPLPHTIDVYARSSKIHWVMQEIAHHPEDKYLIFGDPWVLGYLTEAIDLIQVKSVYVGPNVSLAEKQDALALFELPAYRVCLLDLKLAARGLNLTAANRVIFIEPVWKPDIEAQAIKRVHRMGQTKPVFVTKLYIQGTFEEDMINRGAVAPDDREDQFQMSRLIEKPRFVETADPPPLLPIKLVMGPAAVEATSSDLSRASNVATDAPPKRRLAFALPDDDGSHS